MATIRRAVIDVGTNSVKLLVADISGREVRPVFEDSEQTRLGAGFFESKKLQPHAVEQSARTVATFAAKARELNATSTRVIATSAAREAINGGELTSAIERASGLKAEIISGDDEADMAFQGVRTDPALSQGPLLILDVGGGSTEFIIGEGERQKFRASFPLGTVRLLERFPPRDPPTAEQLAAARKFVKDFLERDVKPRLGPSLDLSGIQLVGTGGTATILGRMEHGLTQYDRAKIEGTKLGVAKIRGETERLWKMPLAERKKIAGLPQTRADVILFGALIYEVVMQSLGFAELRVSTRGLRFAAVLKG